jgi:uncharacterized protein (DUF2062 family)
LDNNDSEFRSRGGSCGGKEETLKYNRQIRYYYLRFIRLRGEPHELALGIALGILAGMMPIMPFQMALAVTLAILFKGSKLTAALGTWISNPLNWYFLYYYSYKIGASILGLPGKSRIFSSVMASIRQGEEAMVIVGKIFGTGGVMMAAFLIGGLVMALLAAVPSYFIFLRIFHMIRDWRKKRRDRKYWRNPDL